MSDQSYTYERLPASERVAVMDAPFVCGNPDCDEARPPAPRWAYEGPNQRVTCPRCQNTMHRAPCARLVAREEPTHA